MSARAVSLKERVGQILWQEWDPIGVNHFPEAVDEYESYVPVVVEALLNKSTADDIAAVLIAIETERMGLPGIFLRAERVARQLVRLQASN